MTKELKRTDVTSLHQLSSTEREVLTVSQLRADAEVTKIAKLCNRPVHQVRYAITRLENDGIIRRLPYLNLQALGLICGSVHFTTSSLRPLTAVDVVKKLQHIRRVAYVSCFCTEPQYEVSFAVDSIYEVRTFADELAKMFPISEKLISLRMEGVLCGRKYLSDVVAPGPAIVSRPPEVAVIIDAIDKKLLHLLVIEPRSSIAKIAALASLPESSARLRIQKLKANGVIAGFRYHFQNNRFPVSDFKLLVYTGSNSPDFRKRFGAFADQHKNVVYRSSCLGSWEFELDIEVTQAHEVATLCHELRGLFPKEITQIKTLPRFYSQSFLQRMFE